MKSTEAASAGSIGDRLNESPVTTAEPLDITASRSITDSDVETRPYHLDAIDRTVHDGIGDLPEGQRAVGGLDEHPRRVVSPQPVAACAANLHTTILPLILRR